MSREKIKQLIRIRVSSPDSLPLFLEQGSFRRSRHEGGRERMNGRRGNTSTGGWREMAAIFPAGSSREPIASLLRALRRQLRLKNCLCHVRHIFLAFPLFSSLAPEVLGLFPLSRPSHSLLLLFPLSSFFSLSPLHRKETALLLSFLSSAIHDAPFRISYFLCSVRPNPHCTPKVFSYILVWEGCNSVHP